MPGNYPDDIYQYNSDPRSPLYVEKGVECYECGYFFDPDDMYAGIDNICLQCAQKLCLQMECECHE